MSRQGSGRTSVAAFSGQIEANRGSGRISDYGFTTPPGSEIIYDFLCFFPGSHRYGLLNTTRRGREPFAENEQHPGENDNA